MGTDESDIMPAGFGPPAIPAPRVIYDGPVDRFGARARIVLSGPAKSRGLICERWTGVDAMGAPKWEAMNATTADGLALRAAIFDRALLDREEAK